MVNKPVNKELRRKAIFKSGYSRGFTINFARLLSEFRNFR